MIKKHIILRMFNFTKKKMYVKKINSNNATIKRISFNYCNQKRPKEFNKGLLNKYFEIPYVYNETTVKVLVQNPTTLFVYWDISEEHKKYITDKYDKDLFNKTRPVLIVKNETNRNKL